MLLLNLIEIKKQKRANKNGSFSCEVLVCTDCVNKTAIQSLFRRRHRSRRFKGVQGDESTSILSGTNKSILKEPG